MTSVYLGHSNERTVLRSRSAPPVEAPAGRIHPGLGALTLE